MLFHVISCYFMLFHVEYGAKLPEIIVTADASQNRWHLHDQHARRSESTHLQRQVKVNM